MKTPTLIATDKAQGLEVWAAWSAEFQVYELFASADGDDYLGACDTRSDAARFARDHFADQACY
jgi:hypothetical protein